MPPAAHRPLEGIRIADLAQVWAGAKATQILAYLGAEVVKVESPRRPDVTRGTRHEPRPNLLPNGEPGARPYDRVAHFNSINRRKLGLTLDLRTPEGLALFKRLVAVSDVVTENFSVGVMDRLGLGYEELRQVRPDIILLSMPGFGLNGPERDYVSWAPTINAMAGITQVVGYEDGPPMKEGVGLPDPLAGIFGAAAILTALRQRALTGRGQHVELAQQEALLGFNAPQLLEWQLRGTIPPRRGNRHAHIAPQGVYPCLEPNTWIALTAVTDREWQALVIAMGSPEWARDERLADVVGRVRARQEIDAGIAAFTRGVAQADLAERFARAGLAAGAVHSNRGLNRDAHLTARGSLETIVHEQAGTHRYAVPLGARFSASEVAPPSGAPTFGQNNHDVLERILGLEAAEIRRLEEAEVISTVPLAEAPRSRATR